MLSSLFCLLVIKRFLKAQAQKKQLQVVNAIEPTERMYEMVNTEKTVEDVYEVIDHGKKEVTYEENPAYAIHK